MTLRARIAAVTGLAVAVAILATAVFTYLAVRSSLRGEIDSAIADTAEGIVAPAHEMAPGPGPPPGAAPLEGPPPPLRLRPAGSPFGGAEGFTQFVSDRGDVHRAPGASVTLPLDERVREIARAGEGEELTDMDVDGTHLRVLTRAAPALGGAVQVARPLDEVDRQLDRLLLAMTVLGGVGIALGVALGALVARTALVPIGRFTSRTEELSSELDPSRRMEVVGDDELARLARSFNATLDALERSVESQRQLVADASHELRTPIASLRANIQTLREAERLPPPELERMRADIVQELDELTALVGDVVELARGAKPGQAEDEVRLDQVCEALIAQAGRRAGDAVDVRARLEPTLVLGEPERISRAISNLLANAVRWSPAGGTIEVDLQDGVLTVRDHGPGFDEKDLPHVFERFYRADEARGMPGSGLGLAIVQQAAEAHGGFAEAANAPDGGAVLRVGFGEPLPTEDRLGLADPPARP